MGLRELVKKVQHVSGFSDVESQDALELMVESLAERLTGNERKDFASQLPAELQELALSVDPSDDVRDMSIIEEFMEKELVDEARAKKQVLSAWEALKSAISEGEIQDIRAQLNTEANALLH